MWGGRQSASKVCNAPRPPRQSPTAEIWASRGLPAAVPAADKIARAAGTFPFPRVVSLCVFLVCRYSLCVVRPNASHMRASPSVSFRPVILIIIYSYNITGLPVGAQRNPRLYRRGFLCACNCRLQLAPSWAAAAVRAARQPRPRPIRAFSRNGRNSGSRSRFNARTCRNICAFNDTFNDIRNSGTSEILASAPPRG